MTKKEALSEARRRWGKKAVVRTQSFTITYTLYQVCSEERIGSDVICGTAEGSFCDRFGAQGGSWEEAFNSAEAATPTPSRLKSR